MEELNVRIGIDMLGVQSPGSRGRGIGRYTEQIVRQLLRHNGSQRFTLYFYENLPFDEEPWTSGSHQVRHLPWRPGTDHLGSVMERVAHQNPDGLDALVISSPMEMYHRYYPPRKPLNGLRCAS